MSVIVKDWNGQDVEIFVRVSSGMVDTIVRAADRATFEAAAMAQKIMYEVTETVIDPNTGEETQVPTGEILPAAGVYLDHLGPVMTNPGDPENGIEPTFDTRHHINMRIVEPALSAMSENVPDFPSWLVTAIVWSSQGTSDTQINSAERSTVLNGVSIIDPDSITTPNRVWL